MVPGTQHYVDFMVKDSKRFADSGGWGWAVFDYNAACDTFRPGTLADNPPRGNDAQCGFTCHTSVKARYYVFTEYGHRMPAGGATRSRKAPRARRRPPPSPTPAGHRPPRGER